MNECEQNTNGHNRIRKADNPKLTITLTGRAPVTVNKETWPVLASATDKNYQGEYEFQSNWKTEWRLTVRQHEDGRTIVYAVYNYSSQYRGAKGYDIRGGRLLAKDADIVAEIQCVADWMREAIERECGPEDAKVFSRLANECVADLPAVEI